MEDVMRAVGGPGWRATTRGGAVNSSEDRWGWRAYGTGASRRVWIRELAVVQVEAVVGRARFPETVRTGILEAHGRLVHESGDGGRFMWSACGRALLKAWRGWAAAGGPAVLRAQAVAAARAEAKAEVAARRERERERRRAYVVYRRVFHINGVKHTIRIVPEAVQRARDRRRLIKELRAKWRSEGVVAGVRAPRPPSPPAPELTAEEIEEREAQQAEATRRLERRWEAARAERARVAATPIPTQGGPGAQNRARRQVRAVFAAADLEAGGAAERVRRSAMVERRLVVAQRRMEVERTRKRERGEVPLTARRVRRATLAAYCGYERMVAARKRAQEDAALAGAVAREMAEATAETEAEERRERRRRRPLEGARETEDAVARRGIGVADSGWLAPDGR